MAKHEKGAWIQRSSGRVMLGYSCRAAVEQKASVKHNDNLVPGCSQILLASWDKYTSNVVYLGCLFFFGLVMCKISSSSEVNVEGLGIFVPLALPVELLVVLQCSFFSKMYSKERLVRKLICHKITSSAKSYSKEGTKSHFKGCPCFLIPL